MSVADARNVPSPEPSAVCTRPSTAGLWSTDGPVSRQRGNDDSIETNEHGQARTIAKPEDIDAVDPAGGLVT